MKRGRPTDIDRAQQIEMRRYREAGVSIVNIGGMWHIGERRVKQILAKLRAELGPEKVPEHRRHLVRAPHVQQVPCNARTSTEH